jgi:hypothetical protein
MDPIVKAAVITAGAKVFTKLTDAWRTSQPPDKNQKKVNKWLTQHYKSLHEVVSPNSVKLLYAIENGKRLRVGEFLKVLYPRLRLTPTKLVKNELRYRLQYLAVLGLVKPLPTISRYQITRLGVAFLSKGRSRKHYPTVLLRPSPNP